MEPKLFESILNKFIISWEGEGPNLDLNAEIQKEDGERIGKIVLGGSHLEKAYLFDIDDEIILFTQRRGGWLGLNRYEIKDSNKNIVGTAKMKFRPLNVKMIMENPQGVEILRAEIEYLRNQKTSNKFNQVDGTNIAEFDIVTKEIKQSFWKHNCHNTCSLTIHNFNYDRKILFGFFVAYIISDYDLPPGAGGSVG